MTFWLEIFLTVDSPKYGSMVILWRKFTSNDPSTNHKNNLNILSTMTRVVHGENFWPWTALNMAFWWSFGENWPRMTSNDPSKNHKNNFIILVRNPPPGFGQYQPDTPANGPHLPSNLLDFDWLSRDCSSYALILNKYDVIIGILSDVTTLSIHHKTQTQSSFYLFIYYAHG